MTNHRVQRHSRMRNAKNIMVRFTHCRFNVKGQARADDNMSRKHETHIYVSLNVSQKEEKLWIKPKIPVGFQWKELQRREIRIKSKLDVTVAMVQHQQMTQLFPRARSKQKRFHEMNEGSWLFASRPGQPRLPVPWPGQA